MSPEAEKARDELVQSFAESVSSFDRNTGEFRRLPIREKPPRKAFNSRHEYRKAVALFRRRTK